jgi:hypothetical protein
VTSGRIDLTRAPGRALGELLGPALLAATAIWSSAMIARFLGAISVPHSSRAVDALLIALPLAFGLAWALSLRTASRELRFAAGWSALLAAVLLLTPQVLSTPALAIEIPGLIALAWLLSNRPAIGAVALVGVTASFGSLSIYLTLPYKRMIVALLAGLWLAALIRFAVGRRAGAVRVPLGVLLIVGYLVISVAQVVLADFPGVALGGFELAPLYITTMLVVAYSQWQVETHVRIVRWMLLIAVLVGAYATLRQIIGPSAAERAVASLSPYNFVAGRQKLIGSFPSGPDLAEWTALAIPFCFACALGMRGGTRKLAWFALPLLAVGLFGSQVRAAAVAVVVAVLVTTVLLGCTRAFPGVGLGRTAVAIGATIALVLGAYAFAGSSSQGSGHSYLSLLTANTNGVSVAQHQYKWTEAFRDLSGHPFGYGLGTAPAGYTSNAPPTPFVLPVTGFSVDNGFLKIALEQGFAVMLVFAVGLALLAGGLARGGLASPDPTEATIALGAAGAAVSFLVLEGAGAFADGIPAIAGWVMIGLGVAQLARTRRGLVGGQTRDS